MSLNGKTQNFVRCLGKHIPAPIIEAPNIGVIFHIQVHGFFRRKLRILHFSWQTNSKSYPEGNDKDSKDMK